MKRRFAPLGLAAVAFLVVIAACLNKNNLPEVPAAPSGPALGRTGIEYPFWAGAVDRDKDDKVSVRFDWGDGDTSNWSGFFYSGDSASKTHAYVNPGTYHVRTQARDLERALSDWSAACSIVVLLDSNLPPQVPSVPSGPCYGQVYSTYAFSSTAIDPDNDSISIRFDWGDGDTSAWTWPVPSGDSAYAYHAFALADTYDIKAQAGDKGGRLSDWSVAHEFIVTMSGNSPPDTPASPTGPSSGRTGIAYSFTSSAYDPDWDDVSIRFSWGDGDTSVWSPYVWSGYNVTMSCTYADSGIFLVTAQAKDEYGYLSAWSAGHTIAVVVPCPGDVVWWWWTDPQSQYVATTSPAVVFDGTEEVIYATADDGKVYAIRTDGSRKYKGSPVLPDEENEFSGHPVFSALRQHIIVGNEDGELYAFTPDLSRVWHWPGYTREDSLTYIAWGTAAIHGDRIYVPRENDSLYYFTDLGSAVRFEAAYCAYGIMGPPVIDVNGFAIFTTDSGYVYKMKPDLSMPEWRKLLAARTDIYAPAIGSDGTIYCGSEQGKVYALNPSDGSIKWTQQLSGEAYRVVISPTALFVGTSSGKLYCLSPSDGSIVWEKQHSLTKIAFSPVLAGDYVYYHDWDDVLFCLRQSDGYKVWSCDCPAHGPGKRTDRGKLDWFWGQPAILSNGNVIVIGRDATYCVHGYNDRPLMDAPWPKWQNNRYNTGRAE